MQLWASTVVQLLDAVCMQVHECVPFIMLSMTLIVQSFLLIVYTHMFYCDILATMFYKLSTLND